MSETPRTDAIIGEYPRERFAAIAIAMADFARMLERELAAMTAEKQRLQNLLKKAERTELREENASLKAECAELRKENEALKCGEYICQSCGLRKDSEFEPGDF